MLMLGFDETIDQLNMSDSVHWYVHMCRGEDGYLLRMAVKCEVYHQSKNGRLKRT